MVEAALFRQQMLKLGLKVPMMSSGGVFSNTYIKVAGKASEGTLGASGDCRSTTIRKAAARPSRRPMQRRSSRIRTSPSGRWPMRRGRSMSRPLRASPRPARSPARRFWPSLTRASTRPRRGTSVRQARMLDIVAYRHLPGSRTPSVSCSTGRTGRGQKVPEDRGIVRLPGITGAGFPVKLPIGPGPRGGMPAPPGVSAQMAAPGSGPGARRLAKA